MVETVLILLLVLGMVIFVLDMGRLLLVQQFLTERSRATVRVAVVNNWSQTDVRNYFCFNSTSAPAGSNDTTLGLLGIQPSQVSYDTTTMSCCVSVKVSGVKALLFIPQMAGTYTLAPITVSYPKQSMGALSL
jgi:hypothetical protein